MDWVEFIKAVGGLGTLVLGIALILAILVFRPELKAFLQKLTSLKLKRGETELLVNHTGEQENTKPEPTPQLPVARQDSPGQLVVERDTKVVQAEDDTPRSRMMRAAINRDLDDLALAYRTMQEAEPDSVERLRNEANYLYLRYLVGDALALGQLQDLIKRTETSQKAHATAHYYLGLCYEDTGHFARAAEAFEVALKNAISDEQRTRAAIALAGSLFKEEQHEAAYHTILRVLGNVTDANARVDLYKGLASLYQQANLIQLQAIALEKALEYRPNDPDLHLSAAYAYGENSANRLSLLHYHTLLRFRDHTAAENNIAIAYQNLKMPMRAISYYKRAADKGSSHAAANLATELIEAGFVEEAEQILEKAQQQGNIDSSVSRALALIEERRSEENTNEQDVIKMARIQQRFFLAFGDAYFAPATNPSLFIGRWQSEEVVVKISKQGNYINVEWTEDEETSNFKGQVQGRGAVFPAVSGVFGRKASRRCAYLSTDGQTLHVIDTKAVASSSGHLLYEFARVE